MPIRWRPICYGARRRRNHCDAQAVVYDNQFVPTGEFPTLKYTLSRVRDTKVEIRQNRRKNGLI